MNTLNIFATRIPVAAGDEIGIYYREFSNATYHCTAPGGASSVVGALLGDPAPGTTNSYALSNDRKMPVQARIEPDADGDGFGDETQDDCPSQPFTQQACIVFPDPVTPDPVTPDPPADAAAPETTIDSAPAAKTKSKQASFAFTSSEAGSTFRCSLDGAPFDPCAAPATYTVSRGKHTFTVIARDGSGNADETPATYSWKVKRKRPKK